MSILPGTPGAPTAPSGSEADRIARLAVLVARAEVATIRAYETAGEHVAEAPAAAAATLLSTGHDACARVLTDARLAAAPATAVPSTADTAGMLCVPVRGRDGETVGAICVLDTRPRVWTESDVRGVTDLAELAAGEFRQRELAAGRESARAEADREHAFLTAVLESLTNGVAACDSDGTLVYFNPALREIHGLPERTLASADWANAYDLYDAANERPLQPHEIPLARAFAGEHVRNEHMVVRTPHRGTLHFLATGSPIRGADGSTLGAVVSMSDVTAETRRRRIRTGHLAIATALSETPAAHEAVATALKHLRDALDPVAADVVMLDGQPDDDIDERVVRAVIRSGVPVQAALDAPFGGYVACAPLVVTSAVVGVVYLAGTSPELLDDLTASIVEGAAGLLGRCLERERAERLARELRATRHDLERVIRHAQDFVWCVEFLPSGRLSLRQTTSPSGVLGGAPAPADGTWTDELSRRVDPQDLPALLSWRDDLVRGRPGEFTCRVRGEDGLVRWIRTRCTVRAEDGRRFVDGISSDVTGQTRFEVVRDVSAVPVVS